MELYAYYGADFGENQGTYIPRLFKTRQEAVDFLKSEIKYMTEEMDYVLDEEFDERNFENENYIGCILFYNHQENWNCYTELYINKTQVK